MARKGYKEGDRRYPYESQLAEQYIGVNRRYQRDFDPVVVDYGLGQLGAKDPAKASPSQHISVAKYYADYEKLYAYDQKQKREEERRKRSRDANLSRRAYGRAATILTGASGDPSDVGLARRSLLGY